MTYLFKFLLYFSPENLLLASNYTKTGTLKVFFTSVINKSRNVY